MTEEKNKALTSIESLGEFGLIERLTKGIDIKHPSSIKGIGDDAAVLDYGDKQMLISTDLLIENIHFDLVYTPLKHLGYKAAVVNISDIAAMNGIPKQMTVSIAISSKFSLEAIEELYAGIRLACETYEVDLIGGDTSASPSGLFISITIIGEVAKGEAIFRNTAKEGELVFVSGDLGAAYMGLLLLEREKHVFKNNPDMQPDFEGKDYLLERQLKPEARVELIHLLKKNNIRPTSMIDISDGLASELKHICKQSGVGCHIYEEKIPVDALTVSLAEEFSILPAIAALNGGEDYELLFTIKQDDYEKIKNLKEFTPIGHITEAASGIQLIGKNGEQIEIKAQGWDAFRR